MTPPSASVIIITRNRPQMVRDCLDHLMLQTRPPDEIIVVDSSTGEETQAVLQDYPQIVRLRIPDGRRNMPQARNLGIGRAQGEIIAFLDDDSMAEPDWLGHLLAPYADPTVGGVGGRIIDALETARANPADGRIGVCHKDGFTTTNFASDPGSVVEVNHVRGCNMSFRRAALAKIGGFDPRYIGSNVCEETDVCLGVTLAGWKLLYQPSALVNHLAAPREDLVRGQGRKEAVLTSPRAAMWSAHNRGYLLFKHFGVNRASARHMLGGMPLLYIRLFFESPSRMTFGAMCAYVAGAWWGVTEGAAYRLRSSVRRNYGHMNIVMVNPHLGPVLGGIQKDMLYLAREMIALGDRVTFVTTYDEFPEGRVDLARPLTYDLPAGLSIVRLEGRWRSRLRNFHPANPPLHVPGLTGAIRAADPDGVIFFNVGWPLTVLPALLRLKRHAAIFYRTAYHAHPTRPSSRSLAFLSATARRRVQQSAADLFRTRKTADHPRRRHFSRQDQRRLSGGRGIGRFAGAACRFSAPSQP